jgi:hypothetical protein
VVNFSEDVVPIEIDDLGLGWKDIHTGTPIDWQRLILPYQATVAVADEAAMPEKPVSSPGDRSAGAARGGVPVTGDPADSPVER